MVVTWLVARAPAPLPLSALSFHVGLISVLSIHTFLASWIFGFRIAQATFPLTGIQCLLFSSVVTAVVSLTSTAVYAELYRKYSRLNFEQKVCRAELFFGEKEQKKVF